MEGLHDIAVHEPFQTAREGQHLASGMAIVGEAPFLLSDESRQLGRHLVMDHLHSPAMPRIVIVENRSDDVLEWIAEQILLDDVILTVIPDKVPRAVAHLSQIGQIELYDMQIWRVCDDVTQAAQGPPRNLLIDDNEGDEGLVGLRAQRRTGDRFK